VLVIKIELPPKYYLAHFQELRENLLSQYGSFFEQAHHDFFRDFDSLAEDSQCLYLRLVNRKGKIFFLEKLRYKEIDNWEGALEELFTKKFVRNISDNDWEEFLAYLPKSKLTELAVRANVPFKKSWSREKLQEDLKSYGYMDQPDFIVQEKIEELTYLLFLFFGKIQDNLSLYTLRDLGVRKKGASKSQYKSRFTTIDEALSHYFYAKLSNHVDATLAVESWPVALNSESKNLREEILLHLAEEHRKAEDFAKCLSFLQFSEGHPGREKRVRLLYQLGMKDECQKELNIILESPSTDGEYLFAEDFLGRKFQGRKRSILTETLRQARKISIDESYFRHPELGVQDFLKAQNVESLHIENYLWNSLFGLLFWEELFESEKTSLFNEFERRPQDLYSSKFFDLHQEEILSKLSLVSLDYLLQKCEEKKDIPNGIFSWSDKLPEYISFFLGTAELEPVKTVLIHMAKDFSNRSSGFPDLLAIENGKVKFFEIKAEGDVLKQTQLLQMTL
jgi:DNA polymerase-3 subunit epsilon